MGFRRSGQLCGALLRERPAFLSEEKGETKQYGGDQGGSAQAGAGVLPHAQDEPEHLGREVLCIELATAGELAMGLGFEPPDLIGCRAVCQRQKFAGMNRPDREPHGFGAALRQPPICPINWTQDGTEMLLGRRCRQGGTGNKLPLDPDG